MSSNRVVRVIARLNVGGPALHVTNLSAGLADRYPTLLVAGEVDEGEADMSDQARARGVELEVMPELGRRIRPWQDVVALVKLVRIFRRVRPAIVHTHTAKAGTLGRVAALIAGVPVRVHTFHGHVFHGYFGRVATALILGVERILARATTTIVAISETQAEDMVRFGICERARVRVIPLGLDLARFAPERVAALRGELRRELRAGDSAIVSIVGRLVPIKNHDLFLRAAAALRDRGRACTFVVVGGGPEEARLRERAHELGLEDRVRFLGWRSDLERIYVDSDVVVLSSRNEGTPVCLIEALAAGRPVVSTDVGGVGDVLEEGRLGLLVPSEDALAMADAVERLLDDPRLREEVGRLGAESIPERFGVGRLLRDVASLYDGLLGRTAEKVSHETTTVKAGSCTT